MTQYESVSCPHCGAMLRSRYRVDVSGTHRVHTTCPSCRKSVTVEHGDGKAKAYKS